MKSLLPSAARSAWNAAHSSLSVCSGGVARSARRPARSGMDSMSKTRTGQATDAFRAIQGNARGARRRARGSEDGVAVNAVTGHAALELEQRLLLDLADAL